MAETPSKARSMATHKAVSPPIQPETALLTPNDAPAQLSAGWIAAQRQQLLIASALLELLVLNLDAELTRDGGNTSGDVMCVLQHAEILLDQLSNELLDIVGELPSDLRWCTVRAKSIVSVVERMTFEDGWTMSCYDTTLLVSCFDTAGECIKKALRALETMEASRV